jgi:hypothetical protein
VAERIPTTNSLWSESRGARSHPHDDQTARSELIKSGGAGVKKVLRRSAEVGVYGGRWKRRFWTAPAKRSDDGAFGSAAGPRKRGVFRFAKAAWRFASRRSPRRVSARRDVSELERQSPDRRIGYVYRFTPCREAGAPIISRRVRRSEPAIPLRQLRRLSASNARRVFDRRRRGGVRR